MPPFPQEKVDGPLRDGSFIGYPGAGTIDRGVKSFFEKKIRGEESFFSKKIRGVKTFFREKN